MKKEYTTNSLPTSQLGQNHWPTNEIYDSVAESEKQYKTQKIKFEQYAKDLLDFLPTTSGKLLDVGCGLGWVVAEANKRGFDALGIDQAKPYIKTGKKHLGVNLQVSDLEHFRTSEKFDALVLKHVLEHIKDADNFLKKAHTLLNKNGILLVACPNIDSLMYWLFKQKWYGLQPAQHVWQFTPVLISKVIARNGFTIERVITNNLDYDVPGIKGIIFRFLTTVADIIGKGDQVVVIAKKAP